MNDTAINYASSFMAGTMKLASIKKRSYDKGQGALYGGLAGSVLGGASLGLSSWLKGDKDALSNALMGILLGGSAGAGLGYAGGEISDVAEAEEKRPPPTVDPAHWQNMGEGGRLEAGNALLAQQQKKPPKEDKDNNKLKNTSVGRLPGRIADVLSGIHTTPGGHVLPQGAGIGTVATGLYAGKRLLDSASKPDRLLIDNALKVERDTLKLKPGQIPDQERLDAQRRFKQLTDLSRGATWSQASEGTFDNFGRTPFFERLKALRHPISLSKKRIGDWYRSSPTMHAGIRGRVNELKHLTGRGKLPPSTGRKALAGVALAGFGAQGARTLYDMAVGE